MPTLTLPLANFPERKDITESGWERGQASFYYKIGKTEDQDEEEYIRWCSDNHIHVAGTIWNSRETIEVNSVSIKHDALDGRGGRNVELGGPVGARLTFGLFRVPNDHPPHPLRQFYIKALENAGLIAPQ